MANKKLNQDIKVCEMKKKSRCNVKNILIFQRCLALLRSALACLLSQNRFKMKKIKTRDNWRQIMKGFGKHG